ncbi:MAG: ABC transporter ATP-binding protein [Desulfosarcina sp.]|nr:ABC transporter ATP-binding protein [Desulfobacterales bacterium]
MRFEAGHFIALLGPNGAGKTTLLRTLSGHLKPLDGSIDILGQPLDARNAMELAKIMAVVLTDRIVPPLLSVLEFTALGRYPHTDFLGRLGPADHQALHDALAAVGDEDLTQRLFTHLSDGERQKVLVARALAQQPRILLLDEPTMHLDLKHRMDAMVILRDLCRTRGVTVVASLHEVDVAAKVADRVALVNDGGLSDWGTPETVLTGPSVANLYAFNGICYDRRLGSIELQGRGCRGRVFVVAGMGSGALVYRMLAKQGFTIATGVVHTNDLDYFVARALGAVCTTRPPMLAVDNTTVNAAAACLATCDVVIDCGFEIGSLNRGNLVLLHKAMEKGKPVLSLRKKGQESPPSAKAPSLWTHCDDIVQLIEALDRRVPP